MREKIIVDLKNAMKNQNKELLTVVRMVKGAVQLEEIKLKRELTDDEVVAIINKQIKSRKESIVEFEKGNRDDLINQTKKEIEILNRYMPKQMTEAEITKIIEEVIIKVKPVGLSEIGKIMASISPLLKGKADMSLVNKLVKERLN